MLCYRCGGTGRYLGIGMMMTDCTVCIDEESELPYSEPEVDRKSKSYKKAIKDIMAINPDITRKEAVIIFDKAYKKSEVCDE
jgi:hypothetical protein